MNPAPASSIRPLTPADHTAWISLRQALWLGSDATTLAAEDGTLLAQPQRFGALVYAVLLAFDGDRPVGFVEVSLRNDMEGFGDDKVGYVEGVYVAPPHQRRGLGRALVDAAAAWTREQGSAALVSDVLVGNDASIDFHHRIGFAIAGEGGGGAERQMLLVRRV